MAGPSYTADTLERLHAARLDRIADFLHHRRGRVRRNCHLASLSRGPRSRDRSSWSPGRATSSTTLAARLPRSQARIRRGRRARLVAAAVDFPVDMRRRPTFPPRTCGERIQRGEPASTVSCRRSSRRISVNTVSINPFRQISCMAKTEHRRGTGRKRLSGEISDGGARRRSTRRPWTSSCSTCATRRHSPTSFSSAPDRMRGRCRRSPTRSRRRCKNANVRPSHVEGYDRAEWILMDFFTFIVHVFTPGPDRSIRSSGSGEMPSASWFPIDRAGRTPRADAVGALLRAAVDGLLAVLLAPVCAACHQSLEAPTRGPVCASCWNAIRPIAPPYCRGCGDPLPSWRAVSVAESRCARCRRIASRTSRMFERSVRTKVHFAPSFTR